MKAPIHALPVIFTLSALSFSVGAQPAPPLAPESPGEPRPASPLPAGDDPTAAPAPALPPPPVPAVAAPAPSPSPVPAAAAESSGSASASDEEPFAVDPSSDASMMIGEEGPKLEFYGFADFSYSHVLMKSDNIWRHFVAHSPSFYAGHLNLYMSSTLAENWRSLAEVRFTYSPLGDESTAAADGSFPAPDTSSADYGELQRTFSYGGIEIQRVWVEYQLFDFLSIRGGAWFTPYGYWNDDHGFPTIITVHRPFPISDQIFPEKQTGLVLHGKYFIDSTALGYFLTLSNGRGPYDLVRDLDNNKAVGGRFYVDTTALGNLTVGVDFYRGRYTASTKRYRVDSSTGAPTIDIFRTIDSAYEELSLGVDMRLTWKGLHLQGELMLNDGAYDDEYRPLTAGFDPRPAFAADYRRVGGYALAGYRTPWVGLMPYAMVEYASYTNSDLAPPVTAWTGGVNLRPTPNVVLKAELALATFEGTGSTGLGAEDLPYFGSQVAWAF